MHGPAEIFGQDSFHILRDLANNDPYQWNPQNHILYHVVLEWGHRAWQRLFGGGFHSTYRYLKLFAALTGLAFLAVLRNLARELGLAFFQRLVLLFFAGASVSIWFHFSAFESHGLAMPALGAYLICLVRLRDRDKRTWVDRVLLIGSLLVLGWTRIDLFRFAAASALLPLLPGTRLWWRSLIADLLIVVVFGIVGNTVFSRLYFDSTLGESATKVLERDEGRLRENFRRVETLAHPTFSWSGVP